MDIQSCSTKREQGQEFSINPWKLDLVGNYFQPKDKQEKFFTKSIIVAEDFDGSSEAKILGAEVPLTTSSIVSSSTIAKSSGLVIPSTTKPSLVKQLPIASKMVTSKNVDPRTSISKQEMHVPVSKFEENSFPITQKVVRHAQSDRLASLTEVSTALLGEVSTVKVANDVSEKCKNFQGGKSNKGTAKEVMEKVSIVEKAGASNVMLVKTKSDIMESTSTESTLSPHLAVSTTCPDKLDSMVVTDGVTAVSTAIPTDNVSNISRTNNHAAQGVLADGIPSSYSSPICSSRPALVKKLSPQKLSLSPTSHSPSKVSQDRGSTCVSVILKSSRLISKASRLNLIAKKRREVEQLVSSYNLKFSHQSCPGVQVRLDYCFHQSEQARRFFKAVYSLAQSQTKTSPPKMVTCILFSEEDLGYHHEPVLTEHDLLAVQSPEYCRNIFRTCALIRVKKMNDVVVYEFKSVTDVNKFLYDKSSSVKTRTLGLLRKNVVPKMIMTDSEGFYRLFSAGPKVHDSIGKKHRFRVDGPFLLFRSKLDLFTFLVSDEAADIDHLQFYEENIKDIVETGIDENECQETVEQKKDFGNALEVNDIVTSEFRSEESKNLNGGKLELKVTSSEEVAMSNDVPKIITTDHDGSSCSMVESIKVFNNHKKQEVGGISELGNISDKISNEEDIVSRSLLEQKDQEIRSLKNKLLFKERKIQTEIMEKTAVKNDLKQLLSQLEEINKISKLCE